MIRVDANGLSCPEPVIMLKKVIDNNNEIELLVDNQTSVATCGRFAKSKGFSVNSEKTESGYILRLKK